MNHANFASIIKNTATRKGLRMVPKALASIEEKKKSIIAKKAAGILQKLRKSAADRDRRIEATMQVSSFHNPDMVREVLRLTDDELLKRDHEFTFQVLYKVIQELFKLRAWNGEPCIATMHKIITKHIFVNGFDVALHPRRRPCKVTQ